MANSLNVYTGPDSVKNYFDPDSAPPLPLVELPNALNPYRQDGVRIYAKMMTMHPTNNVKSMPALNLLEHDVKRGQTETVVEYSSGSTVISMAMISQVFYGITDVRAYLSNKTSLAKLRLMQFFGLKLTLFGGPSQPGPDDERGGIKAAERMAKGSPSVINPNQYENDNNWRAHTRWTGPHILRQLPEINLICAGMGTSGTMTGLGTYFKTTKPSVHRLGVCTAAGDRVPGPRSHALLAPVQFPWKSSVDHIEEVGSHDSFALSLELCRHGLVCGPSSGLNLQGLYQFLDKQKSIGSLAQLAGPDAEVHCVFLCCDLPYQYIDEYFGKLGDEHFPIIQNEHLTQVDKYRYDDQWEIDALSALHSFFEAQASLLCHSGRPDIGQLRLKSDAAIVDLRQPADFETFSFDGAVNIPFVTQSTPSPFSNAMVLDDLWQRLEKEFKAPDREVDEKLQGKKLLLLCYDGDSARVATSVLRAHGYEAHSIKGGYNHISQSLSELNEALRQKMEMVESEEAATATANMDMVVDKHGHPGMARGLSAASSA